MDNFEKYLTEDISKDKLERINFGIDTKESCQKCNFYSKKERKCLNEDVYKKLGVDLDKQPLIVYPNNTCDYWEPFDF